jgi:acetate kinase
VRVCSRAVVDTDAKGAAGCAVLTLNGGSSSLKFALFDGARTATRLVSGAVARIGLPGATLTVASEEPQPLSAQDHERALEAVFANLERRVDLGQVAAVGHRIVHGGPRFDRATLVTDDVLAELRRLAPLDVDHLPAEIAIVEAVRRRAPSLPQVACFDTAFHHAMPRVARLVPIPRRYDDLGVRRYGFHGLSYTYLLEELERLAGPAAARGRVVMAHLGAGASLCAAKDGRSIDTTMGFTPTSGIPMATRSGDLDPGVIVHLLRTETMSVDALEELLNKRSGLLGVSDTSPDMRDLLAREATDARAADAVALFCYQAKKAIGALAAALGGIDTLVFSGGIGEHAAAIRARIGDGLEHLGVRLDPARNAAGAPLLSADGAPCAVRLIPTNEELIIARETLRALHDVDQRGDRL